MLMLGLYTAPPSSNGALVLDCTPYARDCQLSTDAHGFERLTAPILQSLIPAFRLYDYGVLYVGLMIDGGKPSVVEYNCRFGDPECQPLMMMLESDLVVLLDAAARGQMGKVHPRWRPGAAGPEYQNEQWGGVVLVEGSDKFWPVIKATFEANGLTPEPGVTLVRARMVLPLPLPLHQRDCTVPTPRHG